MISEIIPLNDIKPMKIKYAVKFRHKVTQDPLSHVDNIFKLDSADKNPFILFQLVAILLDRSQK